MSASKALKRVSQQIRNFSQLAYQITTTKRDDIKVVKRWPDTIRRIGKRAEELAKECYACADEIEVYGLREEEATEALTALTHSLANIGTVMGSEGDNLKILTHTDPAYIASIFAEGDEAALISGFDQLDDLEKKQRLVTRLAMKAGLNVASPEADL